MPEAKVITPSLSDMAQVAEIQHPDFPGERLIACFNPFTKERNVRRREELLQVTERLLTKARTDTQREVMLPLAQREVPLSAPQGTRALFHSGGTSLEAARPMRQLLSINPT